MIIHLYPTDCTRSTLAFYVWYPGDPEPFPQCLPRSRPLDYGHCHPAIDWASFGATLATQ